METNKTIIGPKDIGAVLNDTLKGLDHEEVWCVFLSCTNTVISVDMLSRGTLTMTAIDCRTIIKQALLHNARGFILVHNHPSGDMLPSRQDIFFTERLNAACKIMDVSLMDHLIVSDNRFFSFAEERTGTFA